MASEHEQLEFGDFVLDAMSRQLRHVDGTPVPLTPRLFNALYLFASRPGALIDKRELLQTLWPGVVVEDNNLSQLVSALRRALGDTEGALIRTEPRRGFRFTAPVRAMHRLPSNVQIPPPRQPALAVLPFLALSMVDRDRLLALGMADTLIARLSTLPQIVVRSLGSVRRFAEGPHDALETGRSLDVEWVVDGTLQREGARLRATARLISVAEGNAVWHDRFDVPWTDMFDVQDNIAERVAQALGRRLHLAGGGTRNVDAYQLYLAGLNQVQSVRADGLQRGVELFAQALQIDPGYASAHVGIAEAHRRSIFGADRPPIDAFGQWRLHQERALALAPDLAEAHTLQGWLHYWCDHDWSAAEASLRRAIALNPSSALASFGLGFMFVVIGRCEEGLALVRTARELDPMSLLICTMEASFLFGLGRRAEATSRLSRVLEIEPRFWIAHIAMAQVHAEAGRLDEAVAAAEVSERHADQSTQPASLKGVLLARAGRIEEARDTLAQLQALASTRYVPPSSLAAVLAAIGEDGRALDELERAAALLDVRMVYLKDDPRWRSLHSHPRFRALLTQLRLADLPRGVAGP